MNNHSSNPLSPQDVVRILQDRPRRWILPTIALTLLACLYAVVKSNTWEASQALIIREEANHEQRRPGSFDDVNEMKTVQETILELVRSKSVLRDTLKAVGPPAGETATAKWPTDRDIADLRENMKMTPPNGAEFGKTEVFYLKIKDKDRKRAVAITDELCNQLQHGFQSLRDAKLVSMTNELSRSVKLAESNLDEATLKLGELEGNVGVDLSELRMLHVGTTSGSDLRQKLVEIQNELRISEADKSRNEQLLEVLKAAQEDPSRLLVTPNSLLEALPAVSRLKNGLVDAQIETSKLIGTMSSLHPVVQAAESAEAEISENLHEELALAIRGLEVEIKLATDRVAVLKQQLATDEGRLQRLASLRAKYANLVAMTENRTSLLETARRNLADAKAERASASSVSLISRIDTPDTGINPIGPGKTSIAGAGMLGGLMLGLGYVFLTSGPVPPSPTIAKSETSSVHTESTAKPEFTKQPVAKAPAAATTKPADPVKKQPAAAKTKPTVAASAQEGLTFTGALKKLSLQNFSVVGEDCA